ncbi:uncharacterized protein DS421_2g50960 [Arachis hypogaea]|nr:uncharacterized protein DS421_2g50960 [Arachis hypogaea]
MLLPGGCPALVEGRAENGVCGPRACVWCVLVLPNRSLVRQNGAPVCITKMLPCPCGGQGNVSLGSAKFESHGVHCLAFSS